MDIRNFSLTTAIAVFSVGCADPQLERDRQAAKAMVGQWVERLDAQTTETGVYVRHEGEVLPETDPWGNKLRVSYSRGGMAEIVKVASVGPDGVFGTDDDIRQERQSTNLAGLGEGLKSGAQELASESAKGAVKGLVSGVKESLPKWPRKDDDASLDDQTEIEPGE